MHSTLKTLAAVRTRSLGQLAAGTLRLNESIDSVWQHICQGLKALTDRGAAELLTLNENGLTQRLLTELERVSAYRPYFFHKEFYEDDKDGNSPRADLAVQARDDASITVDGISFGSGQRFLALEAKRLPAPKKEREQEYLIGKLGGVERFKRGTYAGTLKTVGIVGYVQCHAFAHWRDTINGWIDQLIATSKPELPWDVQDKLHEEDVSSDLAQFHSSSLRVTDNHRLTLRHLWVQLAEGAEQTRNSSGQQR